MLTRRLLLAAFAAASFAAPALAQDWKAKFPELTFAVIPDENASGVIDRFTPFVEYLTREVGVPVKLRIANDYAAVIEGQRAGNIHIGLYGPAAYARARMTGVQIEPFAIQTNLDGTKGYHSVLWVKKDSPFQKIEDLKGKNLCLVDPNSASGNNVPRFALSKMNIVPEQFFGRVVFSGSHENAVIGLSQGTCDAAFNWWNDETESNLLRMARKNMVKAEDFRMIFKSEQIVNSPMAYLTALPVELRDRIRNAVLNVHTRDKAAFDRIFEGKQGPLQPVTHKEYEPIIELNTFIDQLRKRS
jgi:phosphonate transport system substrate-binding protein